MNYHVEVTALDCLMIRLFNHIDESNMPWLLAATQRLRQRFGDHLVDLVPSYTTLMLHYDLQRLDLPQAREWVAHALHDLQPLSRDDGQVHRLPVWYDASVGPELPLLAQRAGCSPQAIIERHTARDYSVFALGFAPGFAFMGLVEDSLACPRLATPRQRIARGSLGIAERQTAIYPEASPGGWNIIGRCPIALFNLHRDPHSLLQPGDRVRFQAISRQAFLELGGDDTPLEPLS